MKILHRPGYWTEETIQIEADKFDTRSAFKVGCLAAWRAAHKLGVTDEICSHMRRAGDRKHRFVYEIVCHRRRIAYVGLTMNPEARKKQHATASHRLINAFGANMPFRVISELLPVDNAAKLEAIGVWHYREMLKYDVLNIATAGGAGGGFEIWTDDRITEAAAKYTRRVDFQRSEPGAYFAAWQRGLIDEVCAHMPVVKRPNGYWNDLVKLKTEAATYRHRSAFEKGSPAAFKAAKRLGVLDEICSHMVVLRRRRVI
ncbi:hypothetical protein EVC29_071 [Rhizobium phage RHph_Y52]|nr:hypothetical protein EVB53_069 [Rhizobium phage RHph_Y60]QIG75300.1 hypothetical protein EVC16_071 [Rhizobium phage RHph_Y21]QIG76772.1 hypothetical protein EVC29_071 [Rhizobium phage RHph_Y52]